LKPDLTVLLDISPEEGFARKSGQNQTGLRKKPKPSTGE